MTLELERNSAPYARLEVLLARGIGPVGLAPEHGNHAGGLVWARVRGVVID